MSLAIGDIPYGFFFIYNPKTNKQSCGCLAKELIAKNKTIHGMCGTKLYWVWASIKQRCCNPANKIYSEYGGRGIFLCDEWMNAERFCNWAISNGYREGLSIERINNNDGYYPDNCMWTTIDVQINNTRWNKYVLVNGEFTTITKAANMLDGSLLSTTLHAYTGPLSSRNFW